MKKYIFTFFFGLMLTCLIFAGCASSAAESSSLQVLVDIEYANTKIDRQQLEDSMHKLLKTRFLEYSKREGLDYPEEMEVEYLSRSGIERETELSRLRTELMSGEGPDLFIVLCDEKEPSRTEEAVFTMPEKAMELSMFLSLDEYMESETHFAEWDRMNQAVLAAGRTDEGQQIIPLCYTIPTSVYRKADAAHTPSKEITWMDMLESEDEILSASAVWLDHYGTVGEGVPFMMIQTPMTEFILGGVADYNKEELLFTEDELKQRMSEIIDLADRYEAGEFSSAPMHYNTYLGYEFNRSYTVYDGNRKGYSGTNGIEADEQYTMVPLYSDDGGVTAEITAYAAINRNAKNPDAAFLLLDYLASYEAQKSEWIYLQNLYKKFDGTGIASSMYVELGNIPMYDELMQPQQGLYHWVPSVDTSTQGWHMAAENFEVFSAVRDQITHVRFRNALDAELTKIFRDFHDAHRYGSGDKDKIIADGYRKMQMMLSE